MKHSDPIDHLRSHFSSAYLERLRTTALSAAGFSAGIIFFQASRETASEVSVWAAVLSLMIWLFAWQYVEPYLIHGERTYRHFNLFIAAGLTIAGLVALLVATAATVWQVSSCIGVAFVALSLLLSVAVYRHVRAVDEACNEDRP